MTGKFKRKDGGGGEQKEKEYLTGMRKWHGRRKEHSK